MRFRLNISRIVDQVPSIAFLGAVSLVPVFGQQVALCYLSTEAVKAIWVFLKDRKINQEAKKAMLTDVLVAIGDAEEHIGEYLTRDSKWVSSSLQSSAEIVAFLNYAFSTAGFQGVENEDEVQDSKDLKFYTDIVVRCWFLRRESYWKDAATEAGLTMVVTDNLLNANGSYVVSKAEYAELLEMAVASLRQKVTTIVEERMLTR